MGRGLAGISGASASVEQIDLATRRRIFHEIRRGGAEGDITSVGAQGRRVAFVVRGSAIGCRRDKSCTRLASCGSTFASIAQKDLGAIALCRGVGDIAPIKTERWSLLRNERRRRSTSRGARRATSRRANGEGCWGAGAAASAARAGRDATRQRGRRWIENRHSRRACV